MLKRLVLAASLLLAASVPARAAFDVGDIICETSTTTGTGTLNLAGAVTNYATFVSQIASGSTVNYHITAADGTLETGVGVLTDAAPDTLTRAAYWSTDGSGAELNLSAGTHTVCLGPTTQMFAGMKGFQLYTDDAGAVGGILPFWHDSASSADGDIAAEIGVYAGADDELVGQIQMEIDDGATTTEDTHWEHIYRAAGADITAFGIGAVDGVTRADDSGIDIDDGLNLRMYETEANGDEFKAFVSASANTASTTCTFENDANFIPDSCVGDGVDGSDARLKDIKGPLENPGAVLDQIKIYDYKWNTDSEKSEDIRRGKRGVGPVAQELFNVNPDFVHVGGENPIDDPWAWKPEKIVPYLIAEVQNLRKNLKTCYGLKLGNACVGVSM